MRVISRQLLFLIVFLILSPAIAKSENLNLNLEQIIEGSELILLGKIEDVQFWNSRTDWQIVTLKPDHMLKGDSPHSVRILHQKLFPNQPDLFQRKAYVLIFLKALPSYTAWKKLIAEDVRYQLVSGEKSLIPSSQNQDVIKKFVRDYLGLAGSGAFYSQREKPEEGFQKRKQNFYFKTLKETTSTFLQLELSQMIFLPDEAFKKFTSEDVQNLIQKIHSPQFSPEAKLGLIRGLIQTGDESVLSILSSLFCRQSESSVPDTACLLIAETLEAKNRPIPFLDYSQSFANASPELKVGLLAILGRHHRQDAFSLFQSFLKNEKDERRASSVIEALGELGGERAISLCMAYAKDKRYFVRLSVLSSLGKMKTEKGISVAEEALKSGDPTQITLAAQTLERIGTPLAQKTLGKYYQKEHHGYWEPAEPKHFMPEQMK